MALSSCFPAHSSAPGEEGQSLNHEAGIRREKRFINFTELVSIMRLNCEVEVIYSLALASGGVPSKSSRSRASVCLGKKSASKASFSSSENREKDELYVIVSTAKNVEGTRYKVGTNFRLWMVWHVASEVA